ncbi:hypothetical protein HPO96_31130 [Kribbella sandramycini]|uniref:DUF1542 domain-containing protein n=1 Tax=Kribbella sandramycini TaxID=60450 RepID=A0A7Y4L7C1_9ACTN|nr:hypothetical protein [Kribbella sandramycini]MBB6566990.1 hypothetical protein [Kribbella sandramycini]NOL44712.1 hypothetical protein [Kribbella sandramycini]
MTYILIIAVVVIAVLAYRSYRRTQLQTKKQHEITAAELESVKRTADEDITRFGEELQDLDLEMVGKDLGDGARQDYQRALDAYESAKQAVGQVTEADQIKHVIEILEDGRYAAACVRARVNGEPLPQRRPSCFFNPQHGPSVVDVMWSPPGGAPREVPACAADAERVRAGAEPDVRKVMVGPQRVPYWEAGPAYSPYAQGMFGALGGVMTGMFLGTMLGGMFAGGAYGDFAGGDMGGDMGGGDMGGDMGDAGGDAGGWDFGDFGGGDF